MKEFKDKVAVITGAASGIGRGLAARCAQEGMRVVAADIEAAALEQTTAELKAAGAAVLAVATDVSREEDIRRLARAALETIGGVHLLFNNAGVEVRGAVWEQTLADWQWIINVNLFGVINGVRIFVPLMLEQDCECHIVNTASVAGLFAGPGLGSYRVTKSGVIALSETLYHELGMRQSKIGVSVLYPSMVRSQLNMAERNRPAEFASVEPKILSAYEKQNWEDMRRRNQQAMLPEQFADMVFAGIREDKLYIQTHPERNDWIRRRTEDILNARNPEIVKQ